MDDRGSTSPLTAPRVLIAGIGNIFLGDDAFGVEVVRHLAQRPQPAGVTVKDFGIRGLDLTYALLEDCDIAILVDAAPRGSAPGTLYVIEPSPDELAPPSADELAFGSPMIETHGMDPDKVLRLVAAMGGKLRRVLVVACEPTPFDPEVDMDMSLSPPVQAVLGEAVSLVESLVQKICAGQYAPAEMPPEVPFAGAATKGDPSHGSLQAF